MNSAHTGPKRLIEVDLPIKRISAHARREKAVRHGHISSLHIWWARRPLAACRAVVLAALWPDPADPQCPEEFRREAAIQMKAIRNRRGGTPRDWDNPLELRAALLDFIADFSNWDLSNEKDYLNTSRALVQVAHESLGGTPGTRPLVLDPFAGGGAIPFEALRVGADTFASDLNPVAVMLNKVVLEYLPRHKARLAEGVRSCGQMIRRKAEDELSRFYPKDDDGSMPIAYLWARTATCEGPGCGARIPLVRSLWLSKRATRVALRIVPTPNRKGVDFEIDQHATDSTVGKGTVRRSSATCPLCNYTTPAAHVRSQFEGRRGGSHDAQLLAVATVRSGQNGRFYRVPTDRDRTAVDIAAAELARRIDAQNSDGLSLVPNEPLPYLRSIFNVQLLGVTQWGYLFAPRQALTLTTIAQLIRTTQLPGDKSLGLAVRTLMAFALDKLADLSNSLVRWEPIAQCPRQLFGRQAIGIVWDFAEANPLTDSSGSWDVCVEGIAKALEQMTADCGSGHVERANATEIPLPDDSAQILVTDPPYYDSIPYANLSDFFYVWLKRSLSDSYPALLGDELTPKREEIVQLAERNPEYAYKTKENFEALMCLALGDARRVVVPNGLGVVVFAHKTTDAWEAMLQAVMDAGWVITASWPIDTENDSRLRAMNSAALASSVHLVCRPREKRDGSIQTDAVGDWRDVLVELPNRIHEWMPRLADEGVVGADAIFSCLGPALEVFSQYSRVEKTSGEAVCLKEYLEHVWGAVAKEALAMIFEGADATGFEEDARLTAMWLWTLSTGGSNGNETLESERDEPGDAEEDEDAAKSKVTGFLLEYDTARKIAQGLGAHLEDLSTIVEVKGASARLLPVAERTRALFQKGGAAAPGGRGLAKKKTGQLSMGFVAALEEAEESGGWGDTGAPQKGETVLDRVHQSMIFFGAGRGEALKRFLVDDGVGHDDRFWRLAQALSALYPPSTDEKRWIDGVLARKKGLGF